ncbi:MAG: trypsin-like peptidase domain-containing protein, partial [Dehalococcoidia bacterium]|nr:trypsin-like peptidase domain-containing protein [Dehalococcoidia bacterium]
SARVIGADPATDLAVLKSEGPDLPALTFGDSDALALGEGVVAIGFSPLLPNPPNAHEAEVLRLVVSAVPGDGRRADFIQTNADLHPGDSGGPLLNLCGEVVGINTSLVYSRRGSQTVLASSIAINRAKPVLEELVSKGKMAKPWIGATVHAIAPGFVGGRDLPMAEGLMVTGVASGSPAAQAGIDNGDIIIAADGFPLTLPSELLRVISGHKIGDKMRLTIVSPDGNERNVNVILAEMP